MALRSAHGATVDELLDEADAAMYEAKRAGKERVVRFYPGLRRPPGTARPLAATGAHSLESAAQAPDEPAADTPAGWNS